MLQKTQEYNKNNFLIDVVGTQKNYFYYILEFLKIF